MTMNDYYKYFVEQLKLIYDERESANIADWVLESIGGCKRSERISKPDKYFDSPALLKLNNALQQLMAHRPVQYVLGEAWFYRMKFFVNENVLIPRPETEELVELVVEEIKNKKFKIRNTEVGQAVENISPVTILDIGTGSGCIAISLKKEIPYSNLFAIDVSIDALEVARENSKDQHAQIEFRQLDFLDEKLWPSLPLFDIIISNPPYIPEAEKTILAKHVSEHEPHVALFVSDSDPFIFYSKIAAFAGENLKENGKIFVEVHKDFSSEVQQIFAGEKFTTVIRKDIYGNDRMLTASMEYSYNPKSS